MVPEPTGPPSPRVASRERRSDSRDGCSREERRRMDGLDRPAGPEEERKDDKEPERSSGQRRRKHRERKEEQAARSRTRGREKTRQEEHREHRRSDSDVSSGSRPHVDTTSWRRCHVCHQDVGGGTMIFSTISRITKKHRAYVYYTNGLPWNQALARASKELGYESRRSQARSVAPERRPDSGSRRASPERTSGVVLQESSGKGKRRESEERPAKKNPKGASVTASPLEPDRKESAKKKEKAKNRKDTEKDDDKKKKVKKESSLSKSKDGSSDSSSSSSSGDSDGKDKSSSPPEEKKKAALPPKAGPKGMAKASSSKSASSRIQKDRMNAVADMYAAQAALMRALNADA